MKIKCDGQCSHYGRIHLTSTGEYLIILPERSAEIPSILNAKVKQCGGGGRCVSFFLLFLKPATSHSLGINSEARDYNISRALTRAAAS